MIQGLIDSGADCSIISSKYVNHYDCIFSGVRLFETANGSRMKIVGKSIADIEIAKEVISWEFMVSDDLVFDAVIGRDFLCKYGIIVNFSDNSISRPSPVQVIAGKITLQQEYQPEIHGLIVSENIEPKMKKRVIDLLINNSSVFSKSD